MFNFSLVSKHTFSIFEERNRNVKKVLNRRSTLDGCYTSLKTQDQVSHCIASYISFLKLLKKYFALAAILISLENKEAEKELLEQRLRTTAWVEDLN